MLRPVKLRLIKSCSLVSSSLATLILASTFSHAVASENNGHWRGWVENEQSIQDGEHGTIARAFAPLDQTSSSLLYLDGAIGTSHSSDVFGRVGIGARGIVDDRAIVGGVASLHSSRGRFGGVFYGFSFGLEAFTERFDVRLNYTNMISDDRLISEVTPVLQDELLIQNNQLMQEFIGSKTLEIGYSGFDGDVGLLLPSKKLGAQLYLSAGGFHYTNNIGPDIQGPRGRAELRFYNLFGNAKFLSNVNVTLASEVTDDEVRGTNARAELRLQLPFGGSARSQEKKNALARRMTERRRFDDELIRSTTNVELRSLTPAMNPLSGEAYGSVTFISGEIGNAPDFASLAAEEDEGAVFIVDGSAGDVITEGVVLRENQQIIGGGGAVSIMQNDGTATTASVPGTRGSLNATGNGPAIQLSNGNVINGININGPGVGIFGSNVSNISIENVSVTSGEGIVLTSLTGNNLLSNVSINGLTPSANASVSVVKSLGGITGSSQSIANDEQEANCREECIGFSVDGNQGSFTIKKLDIKTVTTGISISNNSGSVKAASSTISDAGTGISISNNSGSVEVESSTISDAGTGISISKNIGEIDFVNPGFISPTEFSISKTGEGITIEDNAGEIHFNNRFRLASVNLGVEIFDSIDRTGSENEQALGVITFGELFLENVLEGIVVASSSNAIRFESVDISDVTGSGLRAFNNRFLKFGSLNISNFTQGTALNLQDASGEISINNFSVNNELEIDVSENTQSIAIDLSGNQNRLQATISNVDLNQVYAGVRLTRADIKGSVLITGSLDAEIDVQFNKLGGGIYDLRRLNFTQSDPVFYVRAGGTGDGSFLRPGSLAAAERLPVDIIALLGGDDEPISVVGSNGNDSFELDDYQELFGRALSKSDVQINQPDNLLTNRDLSFVILANNGTASLIGNANAPIITLADNNTIRGIEFAGEGTAIAGSRIANFTIDDVVINTNAGITLSNITGQGKISQSKIDVRSGDGLRIDNSALSNTQFLLNVDGLDIAAAGGAAIDLRSVGIEANFSSLNASGGKHGIFLQNSTGRFLIKDGVSIENTSDTAIVLETSEFGGAIFQGPTHLSRIGSQDTHRGILIDRTIADIIFDDLRVLDVAGVGLLARSIGGVIDIKSGFISGSSGGVSLLGRSFFPLGPDAKTEVQINADIRVNRERSLVVAGTNKADVTVFGNIIDTGRGVLASGNDSSTIRLLGEENEICPQFGDPITLFNNTDMLVELVNNDCS